MCGIYGSVGLRTEAQATADLQSFAYRGPDHSGMYCDGEVCLGNNRLAIIDLDERANQPLHSSDGRYVIVFNGEIYNFRALRASLEAAGSTFTTNSDTEVVLETFIRKGVGAFGAFRGMFAVAIYDTQLRTLTLARDHVGMKPLYYYHDGDQRFGFSSELKGLAHVLSRSQLSADAFTIASALGYVPSPLTPYENVFKLERGSVLTFELASGRYRIQDDLFDLSPSEVASPAALQTVFDDAVLRHLVSDAPVGLFFSGGNDSSLIAASLKRQGISLNAYSIIMEHKTDDAAFIDSIGAALDVSPHKLHFNSAQFETALMAVHQQIDEPTIDSSMLAIYALAKIAQTDVKVVLSGEGADEFFFGYSRHLRLARQQARAAVGAVRGINRLPFSNLTKKRLLRLVANVRSAGYLSYLLDTAKGDSLLGWEAALTLFADAGVSPHNLDELVYLENDLLRKMDFATAYASIEGRMPFLDVEVIRAARNFTKDFTDTQCTKHVLKEILAEQVGHQAAYRSKSGLGLAQRTFFSDSDYFMEHLRIALRELRSIEQFAGLVTPLSADELVAHYPYHAYLNFTYWCTIQNLERYHGT
ncbi:asparagine synthase (glutamine-hydrolyzing) [bacterium]|nr:asparagine synthase (glutamine-hydrolyzing) [bacterium]